jgi:hypothetical protein
MGPRGLKISFGSTLCPALCSDAQRCVLPVRGVMAIMIVGFWQETPAKPDASSAGKSAKNASNANAAPYCIRLA